MNNEPNETELKIADEILELDWRAFRPHPKEEFDRYHVAKILAAHRAVSESESVKALKLIDAYATDWHANKIGNAVLHRKRWERLGDIARAALINHP